MRTSVALACSFACLAWIVSARAEPYAQKPPAKTPPKSAAKAVTPPLTPFLGKLAEARASAKERNVPILVHVILDKDSASDEYTKRILPDADVLRASVNAIVIVANNGTHAKGSAEEIVDGVKQKRDACAVLPAFRSCSQHQLCWDDMYRELHDEAGDMQCPQVAIFAPDGTLAARINTRDVPNPAEIVSTLTEVATKAGPGLSEAQLADVKKNLDVGRNALAAKAWPEAWTSYAAVLAVTTKSVWADEALREQPKALAGMKSEYERIAALLVPGTAVQGYQALVAFAKATVGTPLAADVAARVKKVESDKALQPELQAWRLSVEADQLLVEARDAYEQKNVAKGERAVRKLMGKRYASTAAAETARKLWPEIAAQEAEKNAGK